MAILAGFFYTSANFNAEFFNYSTVVKNLSSKGQASLENRKRASIDNVLYDRHWSTGLLKFYNRFKRRVIKSTSAESELKISISCQ